MIDVSARAPEPDRRRTLRGFLVVVLAFTGFIGFEAAAAFGEEASEPLRSIPWAVLTAVIVAIVY